MTTDTTAQNCANQQHGSISDAELGHVNGGANDTTSIGGEYIVIRNGRQHQVGYSNGADIYYYPCSHCGVPMHAGAWGRCYCDPCDNAEWYPEEQRWKGWKDQLIAASEKSY